MVETVIEQMYQIMANFKIQDKIHKVNPFAPDVAYKQHHFQSQFSSPSIKLSDIFWYRWNSNFLGFLMRPYLLILYAR